MGSLAPWHIILLVLVLLLVFGSKRLIGMGKGVGSSVRGFRDGLVHHDDEPPADPPAREAVVEARQATPAPTPEVARAETAEEDRPPPA